MNDRAGDRFPTTHRSVVASARSADPEERHRAFEVLISTYWKPVYKHIRLRWRKSPADASDATREFFTRVLEKGVLDAYDPARARLRTFMRVCVDGVVANLDKELVPVADVFWGDRWGQIEDPFGHRWQLATHKEDLSAAEIGRRAAEALG